MFFSRSTSDRVLYRCSQANLQLYIIYVLFIPFPITIAGAITRCADRLSLHWIDNVSLLR